MYTFVRAIAILPEVNSQWLEVDLTTVPVSTLFSTYRRIYAVLTHPLISHELSLDLDKIGPQLQSSTGTISDYLQSIGNQSLPTEDGEPVVVRNHAVFSDAFQAGFSVQSVNYLVGNGVDLPEEEKSHLGVYAPDDPDDYDYLNFRQKVLPNVNGFYHRSAADSRGFYVINGNKTRLQSNQNTLGLLSFATLGAFDLIPIEDKHLAYEVNPTTSIIDRVYLTFKDADLCGKTPILILGGYMVLLDGETLLSTGSHSLTFKTHKYPFLERYFESKKHLDFSQFGTLHANDNPDWIKINAFKSREYLQHYFTMSQSFLVLLDATHLITEKSYPETQTVPHTFMSWEDNPKWPLVVCEGKHEVYWKQYEDGGWLLTCTDTYKRNYMFTTTPSSDLIAVDSSLYMGHAGKYSNGYFLKLIGEEVQIKTA